MTDTASANNPEATNRDLETRNTTDQRDETTHLDSHKPEDMSPALPDLTRSIEDHLTRLPSPMSDIQGIYRGWQQDNL